MSRLPRFLRKDRATIYHIISRNSLDVLLMGSEEKDYLLDLIKRIKENQWNSQCLKK